MRWIEGSTGVDATLHGDVTFDEDLSDVTSLSDDGYLRIRAWVYLIPHTIEIRSSRGALVHAYYVAGIGRPWDRDAWCGGWRVTCRVFVRAVGPWCRLSRQWVLSPKTSGVDRRVS